MIKYTFIVKFIPKGTTAHEIKLRKNGKMMRIT